MENQIIEQLTTATSKSYETMKNLGDINSSALRKMADLQFDFISMNMESGLEQSKLLINNTNIKNILANSSDFASDYSEKMMGFTRQTVEIITETRDETASLFKETIASRAAPVKKSVKATKVSTPKGTTKKSAKKAA